MITMAMEPSDVRYWKGGQSQSKLKRRDCPMLTDIKIARFYRGSIALQYKTDHDGTEFTEFDLIKGIS